MTEKPKSAPADEPLTEICEGCDKIINEGDPCFRCDDGPCLCADCSPTYADAEIAWRADPSSLFGEDKERREAFEESMAAHLAAGGSKDDKLPLCPL